MKKALAMLMAMAISVAAFTGCGSEKTSEAAPAEESKAPEAATSTDVNEKEHGVLKLYHSEDLETLNNHTYKGSDTREFIMLVGGLLYRVAPSENSAFEIVPEYAESAPKMLDDKGLEWEIKVKDGMKWANGEPLTAEDFEYSFKMMLDPNLLNHRAFVFEENNVFIKNAHPYFEQNKTGVKVDWSEVGVKSTDNNSLIITLESPVNAASLMNCLGNSTAIAVYRDLYEGGLSADKSETNYGTDINKYMSAGPFQLVEWTKGSLNRAVRNPNYPLYDDISLAEIDFTIVPESGTAMQLFESGELDLIKLPASSIDKYGEDPRIMEIPGSSATCLGINAISTDEKILSNKKFRQAVSKGINREELGKLLKNTPVTYYITNDYIANIETGLPYRETEAAKAMIPENYGYAPEEAKKLFDEALAEEGLTSVEIELIYQDGVNSRKSASEYIQQALPKLFGADKITIKLQAVPSSQLSEKLRDHINNNNSFEMGWIASKYNLMDPSSALMEWEKNANRKKIPYYDDEFTEMYEAIKALPVDAYEERTALTAKAEAKMLDDACVIPLYTDNKKVLLSDRVELAYSNFNNVLEYAWAWAKIK